VTLPVTEANDKVGSLAEEALKFVHAISADDEADNHVCDNSWCPLCQLVNHLRDNPEVVENVTRSALSLARSLRDLFEQFAPATDVPTSEDSP
jgi:hypothetical protein